MLHDDDLHATIAVDTDDTGNGDNRSDEPTNDNLGRPPPCEVPRQSAAVRYAASAAQIRRNFSLNRHRMSKMLTTTTPTGNAQPVPTCPNGYNGASGAGGQCKDGQGKQHAPAAINTNTEAAASALQGPDVNDRVAPTCSVVDNATLSLSVPQCLTGYNNDGNHGVSRRCPFDQDGALQHQGINERKVLHKRQDTDDVWEQWPDTPSTTSSTKADDYRHCPTGYNDFPKCPNGKDAKRLKTDKDALIHGRPPES